MFACQNNINMLAELPSLAPKTKQHFFPRLCRKLGCEDIHELCVRGCLEEKEKLKIFTIQQIKHGTRIFCSLTPLRDSFRRVLPSIYFLQSVEQQKLYIFQEHGEVFVCLVKTIRRSVELNYGFNTLLSFSSGSRLSLVFPGRDNFSRLKSVLCHRRRHQTTENSISQKQEIARRLLHIPPQLSEVSTAIKCTIIFGIFIEWKSCKTFLVRLSRHVVPSRLSAPSLTIYTVHREEKEKIIINENSAANQRIVDKPTSHHKPSIKTFMFYIACMIKLFFICYQWFSFFPDPESFSL